MRNVSDKNNKEPKALSDFRSIETLSQIIPIFFQSSPFVFAVRYFDIPDAISCLAQRWYKCEKFSFRASQNFVASRGGRGVFLTKHFFCDWRVTRSLFQIDCALNYYNTHFLHITLRLTKSQLTFPLLNYETSYRGRRIKTLNNFSVRRSPLLSIIFTA